MMHAGQALLLPASPRFVWGTLLGALVANMAIDQWSGGQQWWLPDVLAVTLVFWAIHQPRRVGVGVAFVLGFLMDVHQSSLLGQHAAAYAIMAYVATSMHRRITWFSLSSQAMQLGILFFAGHCVQWVVRLLAGDGLMPPAVLLAPLLEGLLWPVAVLLLLAPQRRPHDVDENRPL